MCVPRRVVLFTMRRNGTVYAAVNCRGTSHRLTRNTVKSSTTITGHRPVAFQLGHVLTPCMEEQTRIDHEIHEIFPLFSSSSSSSRFFILSVLLFSLSLNSSSPPILLPPSLSFSLFSSFSLPLSVCPRSLWPFSRLRPAFARRSLAPVFANYGETGRDRGGKRADYLEFYRTPKVVHGLFGDAYVTAASRLASYATFCSRIARPSVGRLYRRFRRVVMIQRREGGGGGEWREGWSERRRRTEDLHKRVADYRVDNTRTPSLPRIDVSMAAPSPAPSSPPPSV